MIQLCAKKKKFRPQVKNLNIVSFTTFPLGDGEVLDLDSAYLDLKNEFNCREVIFNERFFLVCIKLDNAVVNVSYKGNVKFYSLLSQKKLGEIASDLWQEVFKKNVVKRADALKSP